MGNDVVIGEEVCGFEGVKLRFGLSLSPSLSLWGSVTGNERKTERKMGLRSKNGPTQYSTWGELDIWCRFFLFY